MRAGRMLAIAAVGVGLAGHDSPTADACTCSFPKPTIPADGAVGVPRNVNPVVYVSGSTDDAVVLRGPAGLEIPVEVEARTPYLRLRFVRPLELLEVDTLYQVLQQMEPGWEVPLLSFTTGADVDEQPPAFSGLSSFHAERAGACFDVCTSGWQDTFARVSLDFVEVDDVAYYVLEARHRAGLYQTDWSLLVPGSDPDLHYLRGYTCSLASAPELLPWEPYCLRLVAYDMAGNAAGIDSEVCDEVVSCAEACDPDGWPLDECTAVPEPEDPELIDPPYRDQSGCSAAVAPRGSWLALLAVVSVACRRRRRLG